MLGHVIAAECAKMAPSIGATLANQKQSECEIGLEKVTSLSVATILDPRFKEVGFCNASNTQAAVERLTRECASLIEHELTEDVPLEHAATSASKEHCNLWSLLDSHVESQHYTSSASASATVEIHRYCSKPMCAAENSFVLFSHALPFLSVVRVSCLMGI